MNLNQTFSAARQRILAIAMALALVLSAFAGQLMGMPSMFSVTPAYAATTGADQNAGASTGTGSGHSVNDLWNQIGEDGQIGTDLSSEKTNMGTLVTKAQDVAKTITSILTIISFVSLLFWIARLALSAGNPQTRKIALTGILFSGVALALFGGAWVVVSFFWNLLAT